MGIFEIIIIIAAAIIFVIMVRRFPDTAEDVQRDRPKNQWRPPHLNLPRVGNPFQALGNLRSRPSGGASPANKTRTDNIQTIASNAQYEPGKSPRDLEKLTPQTRQMLEQAGQYFERNEIVAAEKLYLQAASDDPTCIDAYNHLGLIYLKKKDTLDDAEEAFRQAYKYDPENGYISANLGLAAYAKGLYNDAVSFYEKAIQADPSNAERQAHLGLTYLSMRQYAKAVRHLAKAWALEPANQEYKQLLDDAKERERRLRTAKH